MSSYRVKVARNSPRDRSVYRNLAGVMHVRIIAESYLHVGRGVGGQVVTIEERGIEELQRKMSMRARMGARELLRELSRYVMIEPTAIPFNRTSGTPVIPGGTIKGNIRSRLELSFKAKEGVVRTCFIMAGPAMRSPAPLGGHGWRHQRIWAPAVYEERGPPCNLISDNAVCLLCDIFGTAGLKSLVDFSDFKLNERDLEKLQIIDTRYHMRLEAAKPGSSFEGHIYFRNLRPEELGLILFGMGIRRSSLSDPVLLGRLKYHKGVNDKKFGRVRYRVEKLALSTYSEPLRIGRRELGPGESAQGNLLEEIIQELVRGVLAEFSGELEFVDEVSAVERL